jgi:hypothetical protein
MGLSLLYIIVQNHGGMIEVESKLGAASTIQVTLPASESTEFAGSQERRLFRFSQIIGLHGRLHGGRSHGQ